MFKALRAQNLANLHFQFKLRKSTINLCRHYQCGKQGVYGYRVKASTQFNRNYRIFEFHFIDENRRRKRIIFRLIIDQFTDAF